MGFNEQNGSQNPYISFVIRSNEVKKKIIAPTQKFKWSVSNSRKSNITFNIWMTFFAHAFHNWLRFVLCSPKNTNQSSLGLDVSHFYFLFCSVSFRFNSKRPLQISNWIFRACLISKILHLDMRHNKTQTNELTMLLHVLTCSIYVHSHSAKRMFNNMRAQCYGNDKYWIQENKNVEEKKRRKL